MKNIIVYKGFWFPKYGTIFKIILPIEYYEKNLLKQILVQTTKRPFDHNHINQHEPKF